MLVEDRQAEIGEDGGEPQIDLRAWRRVAIFALIVKSGDLDPGVGKLDPEQAPHRAC